MSRLFSRLLARLSVWSRRPDAHWALGAMSFAESSFFPLPPDLLLAPLAASRPGRALHLAAWTTFTSVLGGLLGFALGHLALESVAPALDRLGYGESFALAKRWFAEWGFWAVLAAGFSPIPYKVFTIAAGALSMAVVPFVLASLVGRGSRFFLVAGLAAWGGPRALPHLRRHVDAWGWALVGLGVAILLARSTWPR